MLTVCYINRQPGRGYLYSDTNACGERDGGKVKYNSYVSGQSCQVIARFSARFTLIYAYQRKGNTCYKIFTKRIVTSDGL